MIFLPAVITAAFALPNLVNANNVRSGQVNVRKLMASAKPYNADARSLVELSEDSTVKFSGCITLSTDGEQALASMSDENVATMVQDGDVMPVKSYILFDVCPSGNCKGDNALQQATYFVDLPAYVTAVSDYISDYQDSYCTACSDYQGYCSNQNSAYTFASGSNFANPSWISCARCRSMGCLNDKYSGQKGSWTGSGRNWNFNGWGNYHSNGGNSYGQDISACTQSEYGYHYIGMQCSKDGTSLEPRVYYDASCTLLGTRLGVGQVTSDSYATNSMAAAINGFLSYPTSCVDPEEIEFHHDSYEPDEQQDQGNDYNSNNGNQQNYQEYNSNQGNGYNDNSSNQGNGYNDYDSNQGNSNQGNGYNDYNSNQGNSNQGSGYNDYQASNAYQMSNGNEGGRRRADETSYQGNSYQGNNYQENNNQGNGYQGNDYQGNNYQENNNQGNNYQDSDSSYYQGGSNYDQQGQQEDNSYNIVYDNDSDLSGFCYDLLYSGSGDFQAARVDSCSNTFDTGMVHERQNHYGMTYQLKESELQSSSAVCNAINTKLSGQDRHWNKAYTNYNRSNFGSSGKAMAMWVVAAIALVVVACTVSDKKNKTEKEEPLVEEEEPAPRAVLTDPDEDDKKKKRRGRSLSPFKRRKRSKSPRKRWFRWNKKNKGDGAGNAEGVMT